MIKKSDIRIKMKELPNTKEMLIASDCRVYYERRVDNDTISNLGPEFQEKECVKGLDRFMFGEMRDILILRTCEMEDEELREVCNCMNYNEPWGARRKYQALRDLIKATICIQEDE